MSVIGRNFSRLCRYTNLLMENSRCFSGQLGDLGGGAGKGGGGGGSIRSAGGSFGKMEAAHEEEYFYKKQREQLAAMKDHLHDQVSFHEEQIKRHTEALAKAKQSIEHINKK